ncbi:hypothetical protein MKEN_00543800 [Mycena kentingensis (nom. inval.)]|nr:hypothetical protein MKEN_00543800 [Mycena kentingensis (nom. inval.)]
MGQDLEFDIDVVIMHEDDDPMVLWNRFVSLSSDQTAAASMNTASGPFIPAYGAKELPASAKSLSTPQSPSTEVKYPFPTGVYKSFPPSMPSAARVPVHIAADGGPDPALAESERKNHQCVQTVAATVPVGSVGRILGNFVRFSWACRCGSLFLDELRLGQVVILSFRLRFILSEKFLGTSATWVLGHELQESHFGVPGDYGAHFWFPVDRQLKTIYRQNYADGSYAVFTMWDSWMKIKLSPSAPVNSEQERTKNLPLRLGIAHEVVGDTLYYSHASGMLGLGPRMIESATKPPSFLLQIRDQLVSPEMTIQLSPTKGRFAFGRRKETISTSNFGRWSGEAPHDGACSDAFWALKCPRRVVGEKEFSTPFGHVVFDSGCGSVYIDDDAAKHFYSLVPSAMKEGNYYYIPVPAQRGTKSPAISWILQGQTTTQTLMLTQLLHDRLSPTVRFGPSNASHIRGIIQSKKSIGPNGFIGPDIIGRAGLIYLEVNFKFPVGHTATVSWRSKRSQYVDPTAPDWGVPNLPGA